MEARDAAREQDSPFPKELIIPFKMSTDIEKFWLETRDSLKNPLGSCVKSADFWAPPWSPYPGSICRGPCCLLCPLSGSTPWEISLGERDETLMESSRDAPQMLQGQCRQLCQGEKRLTFVKCVSLPSLELQGTYSKTNLSASDN